MSYVSQSCCISVALIELPCLWSATRTVVHHSRLSADVNGWPKPSCRFPEWLVSFSWRDMAGKQLFNSSSSSQTFVGFNRRKSGAKLRRRSEYRCIETLRHVTEDGLYTVLAFSTHEW